MECSNCGTKNDAQFRFCENCGTPLSIPTTVPQTLNSPKPISSAFNVFVKKLTEPPREPYLSSEPLLSNQALTIDQRRAILDEEVARWVRNGFQLVSRTDTTAQLIKPKKLSCGILLLSLVLWLVLIGIFITAIILFAYFLGKPESIYLQVNEQGRIKRTNARLG